MAAKGMPRRETQGPPNDSATHRDLLLFEERLKTNAAQLQHRKSRYQLFLIQLLAVIVFLLSEAILQTSFLTVPYAYVLRRFLPDIHTNDVPVALHPYFASGLLFVAVTTLVLFFASGMYSEKIAYANKYVPHANRALRSFNMYLNMRKPPLRFPNPLSILFPRPQPPSASSTIRNRSVTSPTRPLSPIPPATNPRGELIFSSRVDRAFRDSYERYRAAFERKREERERVARAATFTGWLLLKLTAPFQARGRVAAPMPMPSPSRTVSATTASLRGRTSAAPTPTGSRRTSPVPKRNVT